MIKSDTPMPLQVDGEHIGTSPVEIEILPGAVEVFVLGRQGFSLGIMECWRIVGKDGYG